MAVSCGLSLKQRADVLALCQQTPCEISVRVVVSKKEKIKEQSSYEREYVYIKDSRSEEFNCSVYGSGTGRGRA